MEENKDFKVVIEIEDVFGKAGVDFTLIGESSHEITFTDRALETDTAREFLDRLKDWVEDCRIRYNGKEIH